MPVTPVSPAELKATFSSDADIGALPDDTLSLAASVAVEIGGSASRNALLWLTAHVASLMTSGDGSVLSGSGGSAGEIQSEAVGPISVTYKTQAESGQGVWFTSTRYGRIYLMLCAVNPNRVMSTRIYPSGSSIYN